MIIWGLISRRRCSRSAVALLLLRLLLGVAEAGFFPGIILYLTLWYTRAHRARWWPVHDRHRGRGRLGGPVSGWITPGG